MMNNVNSTRHHCFEMETGFSGTYAVAVWKRRPLSVIFCTVDATSGRQRIPGCIALAMAAIPVTSRRLGRET